MFLLGDLKIILPRVMDEGRDGEFGSFFAIGIYTEILLGIFKKREFVMKCIFLVIVA